MNASKIKPIGASLLRINRNYVAETTTSLVRQSNGRITSGNYSNARRRFLSSNKKAKKPKLSKPESENLQAIWCTSQVATKTTSLDMGKFGLKRFDYSNMMPPVWTTPPHPPTKTLAERVVFPLSIVVVAGIVLWVYMSPEEEDMKDYWKRVESGQILLDDDDDEWEDDDDEEEE